MLLHLSVAALIVVGPVMGLCLPWARLTTPDGPAIRVLTCNIKSHCQNTEALSRLVRVTQPDIVALQGCWVHNKIKWPNGWNLLQDGELLIASRYPLRRVTVGGPLRPGV